MEWILDLRTFGGLLGNGSMENFLYIFVTFLTVAAALKWWYSVLQMPPGPTGLPVVGYLPWLDAEAPYLSFSKIVDQYGKICSLKMGGVTAIILADAKIVKETLSLKTTAERAPLFLTHGLFNGYGLICSDGPLWRDHRKFILGFMRDQGMRAAVARANMEQRIHLVAKQLTDELAKTEEPIEMNETLLHHVGNIMMELIYGKVYSEDDPLWRWQRYMLDAGSKLIGVAGPLNFLPWLRHLPMYKRVTHFIWKNHQKSHILYQLLIEAIERRLLRHRLMGPGSQEELDRNSLSDERSPLKEDQDEVTGRSQLSGQTGQDNSFDWRDFEGKDIKTHFMKMVDIDIDINDMIEELEKRDREKIDVAVGKDFVPQNVVEAYIKERSERGDDVGNFTYKQIRHVNGDLFGAGSETTITTFRWHLLNMALFPEAQTRVQKELDELADGRDHIPLDESSLLPYTQASIMETQRLRSIVPLGLPHGTSEDLTIEGYHVPAGSMLVPFLWFIHHDPDHWDSPDDYIPERFIDEEGKLIRNHPAFMPFQTGRTYRDRCW
ncbi:cytochrome P450 306a1 isoform X2 [Palaemon carinicauda]|uniref:cytochrome P450 306a1 isoform X2 n=1 Tax=Palaemon carinicauda TaxID=392227 RepID=UPI0035B649DC